MSVHSQTPNTEAHPGRCGVLGLQATASRVADDDRRKPERWKAVWRACVALHNLCVDQACPRTRCAERRTHRFPHGPRERSVAGKRATITKRLAEVGLQRPPHPQ